MPDLSFQVERARPERPAAVPSLLFTLRITESGEPPTPTPVRSIVLHCQIRIEPARRPYSQDERARLCDVFGTSDRWGQTLRSMLWTHAGATVPPFEGSTAIDLPVPCSYDLSLATTRYFDALDDGDLPLSFLFSGTIFYEDSEALQVTQISWEKEAGFRLPQATWRELMERYYPNTAWLPLRKDVFSRLDRYRSDHGLPTMEQTIERLLARRQEELLAP